MGGGLKGKMNRRKRSRVEYNGRANRVASLYHRWRPSLMTEKGSQSDEGPKPLLLLGV